MPATPLAAPSTTPWRHALDALATLPGCLLVVVDAQARVRWISDAAAAFAGVDAAQAGGQALPALLRWARPQPLHEALERGDTIDGVEFDGADAGGATLHVRLALRRLGVDECGAPLHAVSLVDLGEARRARQLAEKLELAQEFGRIGLWERDLRTFEGRWDRHMFRFWGLDPDAGMPDYATSSRQVPAQDRITETFLASLRQPGSYGAHFRVVRPDGSVRRLHSQWRVLAGADARPERVLGVMMDDTEAWELARSVESTQQQLQLALGASNIGLWRHDLRTDLMRCDARAFEILGLPVREQGLPLAELRALVHPDDLADLEASAARTLATGEPSDAQARYRRSDGQWRHVLSRRVLERDATGAAVAFVGVALDLTEQVERNAHALELAQRLDVATRAARVGIWTATLTTDETDWNAQMYELFDTVGSARPPSLAEWLSNCVHPDDREHLRSLAVAYLKAGDHPLEAELRALRRDGGTRWIVLRADVDRQRTDRRRLFGVALDVTEQHEAMQALRRAHERAELITRGVGIGTWEVDLDSGRTTWDAQMFALRGLPPRDTPPAAGERMALVHPDDRGRLRRQFGRADAARASTQAEFRVRWPDGSWRWLASRSALLPAGHGSAARRIGIEWDVTDVKAAEAALRDKLIAQRASEAKSRFLARMSHELRTPLNAVLGFAQLLLDDERASDPARLRNRLLHIRAAGRHLLSLINDVLDLSSIDSGEMRLELGGVWLDRLVHDTLPLVEATARDRGVRLDCGRLDLRVRADATRLRQVLVNLLSNAVKYNRDGGWVRVEAQPRDADGARRVAIVVSDSGRGLDAAQLRQLFEPFNRLGTEREGIEGTGIGLAIVKALVERMGGRVAVSSRPAEGSRFEVELDAAGDDEPDTAPAPLPDETPSRPGALRHAGRLLYIEDNPVNLMIVAELLARRRDLTLATARDGASGVRTAQAQQPDLVLVDMQLPDFDGLEVLRRLRADERTAAIPCIAVSANAMPDDIDAALAAGFADYWTKPLDFRAFMRAIEAMFGPSP